MIRPMRLLLLAALLTACTTPLRPAEEARAPGPLGKPRSSVAVLGYLEDPGEREAVEAAFVDRLWANDIRGSTTGTEAPAGDFLLVRIELLGAEQHLGELNIYAPGDTNPTSQPRTPAGSFATARQIVMEASYWASEPRRCVWVLRSAPFPPAGTALSGLAAEASDFAGFVIAALKKRRLIGSP